jgi:hypothetical protein
MLEGSNIEHVGAPMRLDIQRLRETGITAATLMALVQKGAAIEGPVYSATY